MESGDPSTIAHFERYGLAPQQVSLVLRLYVAYRECLQVSGNLRLTDFALLQQEAFNVLEQFDGSGSVFKHVIVDEYQDTNTIQERIFFKLAEGHQNICVVGDDDQALYRFRGATVENHVEFPSRCRQYLKCSPRRISLDTNYRSRNRIVEFYTSFIHQTNWEKPTGGAYRVVDKEIHAYRVDGLPSVVASAPDKPDQVCAEVAALVKQILDQGKVENPNQIAFLFPSLKYEGEMVAAVRRMKDALEAVGLRVYAPRARAFPRSGRVLTDVFGLLIQIFGHPPAGEFRGRDYERFQDWVGQAERQGQNLIDADPLLKRYIRDLHIELENARSDYQALMGALESRHWTAGDPYRPDTMKRVLYNAAGLSERGKRLMASVHLDRLAQERLAHGNPLTLAYIVKRVTSIDWTISGCVLPFVWVRAFQAYVR